MTLAVADMGSNVIRGHFFDNLMSQNQRMVTHYNANYFLYNKLHRMDENI